MARHENTLIAQIESDALDESVPVATALRKCLALGGRSGSEALRDWATRELQGYGPDDELPLYRTVPAPLKVDAISGNVQITGQQYPASALPEVVRGKILEEVHLRDGAGAIEALLKQPQINLQPAGASTLTRLMNAEIGDPFQHIISLYWSVSPAAIEGVLDQVRTALVQLVAGLRANMSADDEVPSEEAANQAINLIIAGKRHKVNLTSAQASGASTTATTTTEPNRPDEPGWWTRGRRIGAFVVGSATVAAAVVATVEFVH